MVTVNPKQNISIGNLLASKQATPITPQQANPVPAQVVQPQVQAKVKKPVDKKRVQGWNKFLNDPRLRAGLAQLSVNLLAGQGAGEALGGGFAAIGRAGKALDVNAATALSLQAKQAKGTGGTGGRRGSSGGTKSGTGIGTADEIKNLAEQLRLQDEIANSNAGLGNEVPILSKSSYIQLAKLALKAKKAGVDPNVFVSAYRQDPNAATAALQTALQDKIVAEQGNSTPPPPVKRNTSNGQVSSGVDLSSLSDLSTPEKPPTQVPTDNKGAVAYLAKGGDPSKLSADQLFAASAAKGKVGEIAASAYLDKIQAK